MFNKNNTFTELFTFRIDCFAEEEKVIGLLKMNSEWKVYSIIVQKYALGKTIKYIWASSDCKSEHLFSNKKFPFSYFIVEC